MPTPHNAFSLAFSTALSVAASMPTPADVCRDPFFFSSRRAIRRFCFACESLVASPPVRARSSALACAGVCVMTLSTTTFCVSESAVAGGGLGAVVKFAASHS